MLFDSKGNADHLLRVSFSDLVVVADLGTRRVAISSRLTRYTVSPFRMKSISIPGSSPQAFLIATGIVTTPLELTRILILIKQIGLSSFGEAL